MKIREAVLKERGLRGDALLDALDTIDEITNVGGVVNREAFATLYHRTSKENAKKMIDEQYVKTKEDGIFMSTHPDKQIIGYGDTVVKFIVPVEDLILDDDFGDELHYKIKTKFKKRINVKVETY